MYDGSALRLCMPQPSIESVHNLHCFGTFMITGILIYKTNDLKHSRYENLDHFMQAWLMHVSNEKTNVTQFIQDVIISLI